jgi:hypothetical protein
MDEIRVELDVDLEEARRRLSEKAVTGFWPRLKAAWHRVPGPTDCEALPSYAVRFREGDRFVLEDLGGGLGRWTKGYHMLTGRLEEHGKHTVLRATSALQTWDTFSVRYRVFWSVLVSLLVIWCSGGMGLPYAKLFGAAMGVVIAVFVSENIVFAGRDRKAFARLLESLFEGNVPSKSAHAPEREPCTPGAAAR